MPLDLQYKIRGYTLDIQQPTQQSSEYLAGSRVSLMMSIYKKIMLII